MEKQKSKDWDFSHRQFAWNSYVRGIGLSYIRQALISSGLTKTTMKSLEAEIWKINVQYYKVDDVSEVRSEHARIEGPGLSGPITKREAKIIKIARGYKQPVPLPVIARLLGRPVEKVQEFLHPGRKRASLFKR